MHAVLRPGTITWDPKLLNASVGCGFYFGAVAANRIGRPITRNAEGRLLWVSPSLRPLSSLGAMTLTPITRIEIPAQVLSTAFMLGGVEIGAEVRSRLRR